MKRSDEDEKLEEERIEGLIAGLKRLLGDKTKDENVLQAYLEAHTELLPTPDLLNHRLHFASVISKFRVGDWHTDYAYLTKSTVRWRLVLVELESPHKKLFAKGKHLPFSAEFNKALAQIDTWRDTLAQDDQPTRRALAPLQHHMVGNPLEVQYLLVIGRDAELKADERRRQRLGGLVQSRGLQVMTWDTLLRLPEYGFNRKCVLSQTATGYRIRRMDRIPNGIFAYVGPGRLELSSADVEQLEAEGYDMAAWSAGELLAFNEKWPISRAPDVRDTFIEGLRRRSTRRSRP